MKGIDISTTEFTKKAVITCEHFGFRHAAAYRQYPECKNCSVSLSNNSNANDRRKDGVGGLLANAINTYTAEKLHAIEGPVLYYNLEPVPRTGETALTLHIFGVEKSIAEAILIQTLRSLVNDLGVTAHTVRINSLGDADSQTRYVRELTNYLKKRLGDIPVTARELMKDHVVLALQHLLEKQHPLAHKTPNPLEHLTDQSRRHFREIVEYLDMSETPYEIDPKLLGSYQCFHDAVFSFDLQDEEGLSLAEEPIMIRGGRMSNFFEKHLRKSVPAVGAVAILRNKRAPARLPQPTGSKPSIFMVQLGFGPKVRSLLLLDQLRKVGINVHQNLASDSLSAQLREAEDRGALYTIIIGQKEYVEGTVILRDMKGRNQESLPMTDLIHRLRKVKAV